MSINILCDCLCALHLISAEEMKQIMSEFRTEARTTPGTSDGLGGGDGVAVLVYVPAQG